jgi:hypothetical protein
MTHNSTRLLRIANRIHLLLLRELGQGIDRQRMINERLYARDVLLVCDARPGTDLASLAQHFRATRAAAVAEAYTQAAAPPTGFSVTMSSLFGTDFEVSHPARDADSPGAPPPAPRPWFSPVRWLGR